ncbi:hypothetical protein VP01_873g1 [Puccinia sorghi]|uniref:Reverse transcriptase Ty1/copia-type domain-containing protein n=1 Tax=Puccinia sorghi TaxID=27349 RepID=A0A0L6U8L0_9BASI|nr:hypothetical protein VP01_873g1 [Puccinia sorghi]
MSIFMSTDINKNDELLLEGHYHNNLPILEFESANQQSHLSSAELLHKSLGPLCLTLSFDLSVRFLDYSSEEVSSPDYGKLLVEKKIEDRTDKSSASRSEQEESELEEIVIKEEEENDSEERNEPQDSDNQISTNEEDITNCLIPESSAPVGRILRDRTLQVKPVKWFEDIDYCPSISNACLFIHKENNSFIFFHVNDLIVVANNPETLLGMNLAFKPDAIELSQPGLISKGLELQGLNNWMLNYLACRTRPNLATAVSILSQFNQRPGLTHWQEVFHCWKYLKGNSELETRVSRSGSLYFWN